MFAKSVLDLSVNSNFVSWSSSWHTWFQALAENYPRGNRELRGSFFNMHGPKETMQWFSDHGVELKVMYQLSSTSIHEVPI